MIKNLIFDLGNVFVDLETERAFQALGQLGLKNFTPEMLETNLAYELGKISSEEFLSFYQTQFPGHSADEIRHTWNLVLGDFPKERYEFLRNLAEQGDWRLFLLSNTNEIHLQYLQDNFPFYEDFIQHFEKAYYSHKMGMRKPNAGAYESVLTNHGLLPEESLFIDDLEENTTAAQKLGLHTWQLLPNQKVTDLMEIKKTLFS